MEPTRILLRAEYRDLSDEDEELLRDAFQILMRLGTAYQKAPVGSCASICTAQDYAEFTAIGCELHIGAALRRAVDRVVRKLGSPLEPSLARVNQDALATQLELALETVVKPVGTTD